MATMKWMLGIQHVIVDLEETTPNLSDPCSVLDNDSDCYSDDDCNSLGTLSVPPRVQFFVDDSSDKEDPPPPRRKKHFMEVQKKGVMHVHTILSSGQCVEVD